MFRHLSPHLVGVLQALLVTFLWSTSWVLIKIGLQDIPALTFAGLRYMLAFLCLLPFALRPQHRNTIKGLSRHQWLRLMLLGFTFYTLTQGAQFVALAYLPAITLSLLLNFTAVMVAFLGIALLAEYPAKLQWGGIGLYLTGVVFYFYPILLPVNQVFGLAIGAIAVLANAGAAVQGRHINREGTISPLVITVISMGIGAGLLLVGGLLTQGLPELNPQHWGIILWLAVVNTAFAFTLWNRTLRVLSAVESSVINSTMLVQIAILAWVFLDERITGQEGFGLALAGLGILVVQRFRHDAGRR